ncbi:hypothetical protein [Pseudomonas chlororaphis]|uniref:hypothetical protein n=1 Tax=Pseudomonas chlororaphis TaxID=587753 RepID=UPI0024083EDB|nr:hypothetical protein [Pseudomonas chlororaphis]
MLSILSVRKGVTVKVKSNFGAGPIVVGVVDEVSRDINNGRPGIDYSMGLDKRWAYMDQVVEVVDSVQNN